MLLVNILIGLIGLGLVVFVHEFGHLIAAKAVGIEVEAFSIGWGKKLWGFSRGGTEYRLSVFPVGGYCKMKGEQLLQRAWESGSDSVEKEEGSFFAAAPWRRIVVAAAGPAINLLFAIVVLSIVWWFGFTVQTYENRIVLASEVELAQKTQQNGDATAPADRAGLQTGDEITAINGEPVNSYRQIQQLVATSAERSLTMSVERDGSTRTIEITPALQSDTGAGRIGVYPYVEPILAAVPAGSPAALAGLQRGDQIVSANGEPVMHSMNVVEHMRSSAEPVAITYKRGDVVRETTVVPRSTREGGVQTGLRFQPITVRMGESGPFRAAAKGTTETFETLSLTIRSLGLLFGGVDVTQAVAGPLRISYYVGEVATQGFSVGLGTGLRTLFNFLSLLSVALFFMNLLPIPVLDGGQIVLYGIEGVIRRPIHPKAIYWYQMVGMIVVFALIIFALFGDILFLSRQG